MATYRIVSEEKTGTLEMLQVYKDGRYFGKIRTLTLRLADGTGLASLDHLREGDQHPAVAVQEVVREDA